MHLTEAESYAIYVSYLEPILRAEYGSRSYSFGYDHGGAYVGFLYFDVSFDAIDFTCREVTLASIKLKEELASILYI